MDLQNEAIEIQKIFHQDYKTYGEETEAIKAHLEARFKALGLYDVSKSLPTKEYEIDFGGDVLAGIEITDNKPKIRAAMNGWGNGISTDKITITEK
jgi:hypothetical protein